ncbi:hypothetical protein [Aquimarina sediminis]|uniref:hypothetical protein n=1 Tax=Aquimarina sediminis TaxID=2070536 RepID=UPI000CA04D80|nr:hypothetical protein [Aquimarina sediminis]
MKKVKSLMGMIILALLIITSCKKSKKQEVIQEQKVETYAEKQTNDPCLAGSVWFTIDSTTGKRKTPAPKEDSTSVFGNNSTVSNCDFHQWSWQKFLWLTNDVDGRPLFMENLIQVDNQTVPVSSKDKKIVLSSSDIRQATNDILRTNKAFSTNDTSYDVYYSIHVDSTLYKSIHKYAPMDESEYADVTFPIGALELKVAWVDVSAIADTSSYFVTDAIVEEKDTQIALLGMHVVGIVYNHPEFIWATFEHDDLAPYYDWKATTTSDIPVTSKTNKLLFDKDATGTILNLASTGDVHEDPNAFAVNRYGVPRQAGDVFIETSQEEPENYENIDSINIDVQSKLTDIWKNYFYNGSIWVDTEGYSYPVEQAQLLVKLGSTLHDVSPGKLVKGSTGAYNITMETYEQLGFKPPEAILDQNVANIGNCFLCHSAGKSTLSISHIFNGAVTKAKQGFTPKQTKQKHLDEIQVFIKNMK